ncbi:hypothetical protein GCM10029992_08060 [Glycomyces albus]
MGGQGKTALCLQYARLFQPDHPGGVFLIRLGGSDPSGNFDDSAIEDRFRSELVQISKKIEGTDADELIPWLRTRGQPYLWIVDDLPTSASPELVRRLLAPTPEGKTLITTRRESPLEASYDLRLSTIDPAAGLGILTRYERPSGRDLGAARRSSTCSVNSRWV